MGKSGLLAFCILGCTGCRLTHELNAGHYRFHLNAGLDALDRNRYSTAKHEFARAIWYAQGENLGPEAEAAAIYDYALAVGHLGEFQSAEECLKRALVLDAKTEPTEGKQATMRLFELARLYQAWGKNELSRTAYQRALQNLKNWNAEEKDPIGLAQVLDDYAAVLGKAGNKSEAESIRERSDSIRRANPGKKPQIHIDYYPEEPARRP